VEQSLPIEDPHDRIEHRGPRFTRSSSAGARPATQACDSGGRLYEVRAISLH